MLTALPAAAQHGHHQHHTQVVIESDKPDLPELEALYWQRLDASRQNFVQADVDFMSDMIVHHAQALIMSRLSPVNGASAAVQRLSARIINAQQDEIALMQQWLRDRGQAVPIVHFNGLDMHVSMEAPRDRSGHGQHTINESAEHGDHRGHDKHTGNHDQHQGQHQHTSSHDQHQGQHATHQQDTSHTVREGHQHHANDSQTDHHTSAIENSHEQAHHAHGHGHGHNGHGHNHDNMVGMLSQAQMEELAAARDAEFDRLFLTYMIEHHEGAVYMVNELFMADGAGTDLESYRLAVDIYAEQVTEIAMMRKMLEDMGFPVPEPLRELQEQQERLRNPGEASGHGHHMSH